MENIPVVSIGLAVYNGELYLERAIDSILAQTFEDFELVICDNDSSDRTEAICRAYAERDSRIRYYRNPTNIGGVNNENKTFALSRGKYYRLMAHDDRLAPDLIAKSVVVLEQNPDVVLCYSDTMVIDSSDRQIKIIETNIGQGLEACGRFCQLVSREHSCEATYALMRSQVLKNIDLQFNYSDSDRSFLAELSLQGRFYKINEPLFYKRYHPQRSIEVYSDRYKRMAWFHPEINEDRLPYFCYFMYWRQVFHLMRIVCRAPLDWKNRLFCYRHIVVWMRKSREKLAAEILILIAENPWLTRRLGDEETG